MEQLAEVAGLLQLGQGEEDHLRQVMLREELGEMEQQHLLEVLRHLLHILEVVAEVQTGTGVVLFLLVELEEEVIAEVQIQMQVVQVQQIPVVVVAVENGVLLFQEQEDLV